MNHSREKYYRALFLIAAVYDCVIGIAFALFGVQVLSALGMGSCPPGALCAYTQFPVNVTPFAMVPLLGAFVFVIGVGYLLVWRGDLGRNRDLILVGTLYKLGYSIVAIVFWAIGQLPNVLFGVFGIADAIFFVAMLECWLHLRGLRAQTSTRT
jgi:hypothetical protein